MFFLFSVFLKSKIFLESNVLYPSYLLAFNHDKTMSGSLLVSWVHVNKMGAWVQVHPRYNCGVWIVPKMSVWVCLFSTEGACYHSQYIINTVSRRCTVVLDKSPGSAIGNITIPATHQKYICTMKENTRFLSLQRLRLGGWKALGSMWGLSTCRKKVGLLSKAQLIKL